MALTTAVDLVELDYPINDAPTANALLDQGVDGLISNNPAFLWRVLALRGRSAKDN
jgi:hypothetical protein